MIAIHNLTKQYGRFTAVDGIDLEVTPGEIHGFLGPNGAGKTTSIRMIAGLLKPTSGRIIVNGYDLATNPEGAKPASQMKYAPSTDSWKTVVRLLARKWLHFSWKPAATSRSGPSPART